MLVIEHGLPRAVAVLAEARSKPLFEGERLVTRHFIGWPLLGMLTLLLWGFVWFMLYRGHAWHDVSVDPRERPTAR